MGHCLRKWEKLKVLKTKLSGWDSVCFISVNTRKFFRNFIKKIEELFDLSNLHGRLKHKDCHFDPK